MIDIAKINFSDELIAYLAVLRVKAGRYGVDEDGNPESWVCVERRDGIEGTRWAVTDATSVLNVHGEWEWEPMPSSRDDAFLKRCRFATFQGAMQAALDCRLQGKKYTG